MNAAKSLLLSLLLVTPIFIGSVEGQTAALADKLELRTWSSMTGHSIEGLFYESDGEYVTLLVKRRVRLKVLSSLDQAYVKEQITPASYILADWRIMPKEKKIEVTTEYVNGAIKRSDFKSPTGETDEVTISILAGKLALALDNLAKQNLSPKDLGRSLPVTALFMMKEAGWMN